MAGHSKWHNIKRKKESNDAVRSKIFTKIGRLLTVATRLGSPDVSTNPSLRLAVEKAKQANMPKDTMERAIAKGFSDKTGVNFEEVVYEGYGASGVAFLVYALTDNRNRTVAEIKRIFSHNGGSLGVPGSVSHVFSLEDKSATYSVGLPPSAADYESNLGIISELEDLDDVQTVYTNLKVAES